MSMFDTASPQAESGTNAGMAYAPRVGFAESFELAYEAHVRTSSMDALEHFFEKDDEAQARAWDSTEDGSKAPRLREIAGYQDLARYFVDGTGLSQQQQKALQKYDEMAKRAKERGLDVTDAKSIFTRTQTKAQQAEQRASRTPTTIGGDVGGFVGGALASMDPRTDFFNFATLPVGGAGKTVASRIGSQMGAQTVIETINQLTGVQENRRLLGLEHGFTNAAIQVGATALGAGAIQGVGELGVGLARRWFASPQRPQAPSTRPAAVLEEPPAPPEVNAASLDPRASERFRRAYDAAMPNRSPWAGTPGGAIRTADDLSQVTAALDDWNGPLPWQMRPRTATAVPSPAIEGIQPNISVRGVGAVAREVDPDLFRSYDRLAATKESRRAQIEELKGDRAEQAMAEVAELGDEATRLRAKAATASARNAKRMRKQADELDEKRKATVEAMLAKDTPEMAEARRGVVQADERMRNLAPLVSRAYAKAQGRWDAHEGELDQVLQMVREGRSALPERAAGAPEPVRPDLATSEADSPVATLLAQHPEVRANAGPNDDAADLVRRAIAAEDEVLALSVEEYRAAVQALDFDEGATKINVDGVDYHLDDDTFVIPSEDGDGFETVSVRALLERGKQDQLELNSVMTCSIPNPS